MTLQALHHDNYKGPVRASILCGVLVASIAILDLFTANLNLSILYVVPVLLGTRFPNRRHLWGLAFLLLGLTFAGYYLGPRGTSYAGGFGFRLVNRSFAGLAIIATTARCAAWLRRQDRLAEIFVVDGSGEGEPLIYDILLCGMLVLCIFLIDLVTPAKFNLPILYAVPVSVCATLNRPRLLWSFVAVTIALTVSGFLLPPAPTIPSSLMHSLERNRMLACLAQLGIATMGQRQLFCRHAWMVASDTQVGVSPARQEWVCSFCRRRVMHPHQQPPIRAE
jgi:hypothetical protein